MSHQNNEPENFLDYLTNKAIKTGDIFSANLRNSPFFYFSYNVTLKDIAEQLTLEDLIN